ncbi:MAG: hypothetical protein M1830_004488 [Pleopsidium flavum]|nr:MAG: hypothetical protein M1830_004488 [Pleopsidium flavum]
MHFGPRSLFTLPLLLLATVLVAHAIANAPELKLPRHISRNELTSTISRCTETTNSTDPKCRPGSDYNSLKKGGGVHGGGGGRSGGVRGGGGAAGGNHSGTVARRPKGISYLMGFWGSVVGCLWFLIT